MRPVSVSPAGNLAGPWPPGGLIPAPLRLHETTVAAQWVDYNGHLSEWAYLLVFGDNADAFFRYFGVDEEYRAAGWSLYTAETHLRHLHEAHLGERLWLTLQVLGVDTKRLHIALVPAAEVIATARTLAAAICAAAPLAVAAVLEILRETEGMSVRDGYRVLAGSALPAYRTMLDSQDAREGAQAFTERRRPVWRGR